MLLCTDPDNKETVKAWFEKGQEYKVTKVAHDNEDDAAAVRGQISGAITDVTNALDEAEGVKVKSDKGTLKEAEALKKEFKAIEKREKESLNEAENILSTAEGDKTGKVTLRDNAETDLKTKLTDGKQEVLSDMHTCIQRFCLKLAYSIPD